ncbi:MAG: hypothetical protein EAZ99_06310 [Alphaproteobacteria bacterium]|nr:MAG: hypothetical protein EAZ99_06310 [Alphaproteobacteria bacterium]
MECCKPLAQTGLLWCVDRDKVNATILVDPVSSVELSAVIHKTLGEQAVASDRDVGSAGLSLGWCGLLCNAPAPDTVAAQAE